MPAEAWVAVGLIGAGFLSLAAAVLVQLIKLVGEIMGRRGTGRPDGNESLRELLSQHWNNIEKKFDIQQDEIEDIKKEVNVVKKEVNTVKEYYVNLDDKVDCLSHMVEKLSSEGV